MINDLWYKNAIVYCLSVGTYLDTNEDGIGDFQGLIRRLDYLQGLGVTAVWLLPFQPSPGRDDGYDVCDYYGVDSRYGSLGDFVEFTQGCRQRGIRVLIDLVVNHTSNQHPWFQDARKNPKSKYRDWYVWSRRKPRNANKGMVFPGVQKSTWNYDEAAKAWYFHRFYDFQPDLNTSNPEVQAEILKIMGFWLQLGVSGFRMDAVPFVISAKGATNQRPTEHYDMLRMFSEFLTWREGDALSFLPKLKRTPLCGYELLRRFRRAPANDVQFRCESKPLLRPSHRRHSSPRQSLGRLPSRVPPPRSGRSSYETTMRLDLGRLTKKQRYAPVFAAFGPEPGMCSYTSEGFAAVWPPCCKATGGGSSLPTV